MSTTLTAERAWLDLGDRLLANMHPAEAVPNAEALRDEERAVAFSNDPDADFVNENRTWDGFDLDGVRSPHLRVARHVIASPGALLSLPPDGAWRSGGLQDATRWTVVPPARTAETRSGILMLPSLDTLVLLRAARKLDVNALVLNTQVRRVRILSELTSRSFSTLFQTAVELRVIDVYVDAGDASARAFLEAPSASLEEARFAGLILSAKSWRQASHSSAFRALRTLELSFSSFERSTLDAIGDALAGSKLFVCDFSYQRDGAHLSELVRVMPASVTLRYAGHRIEPSFLEQAWADGKAPARLILTSELYSASERARSQAFSQGRIVFEPDPEVSPPKAHWWQVQDPRRLPADW